VSATKKKKSNKRKTPETKRDEIFRTRRFESSSNKNHSSHVQQQQRDQSASSSSNHLSRLLTNHPGVANALCFANPIRDDEDDDLPLNEVDDDSTLNTCEDTITSTLYFDAKYAHLVEKRPPMPLFSHFKVTEEEDQIRRIVATDSHNSLNMIRLMNEHSRGSPSLPESSSDEEAVPAVTPRPRRPQPKSNVLQHALPPRRSAAADEPPPEAVKIGSSSGSSKSSKSTVSTAPSSSSPHSPEEDGRVVHLG
jgi:hypothetical protein